MSKQRIIRQHASNRITHWLVAFSTFALLFSGFGQMPMYKRYGIAGLPGMGWAADFQLTLNIHYFAGAVLVFAAFYHLTYMLARREFDILPKRGDFKESVQVIAAMLKLGKAPACHKYLGEQRLAYAFMGINFALIIITGLIKVYKNLPGVDISQTALLITTNLHNAAAILIVLGVVGHLGAFLFKENRALLSAMFSGCVDLDYVKERHAHWYDHLVSEPQRLEESLCALKKRFTQKREMAS